MFPKYLSHLQLLALLLPALGFQACETDITDTVHINTRQELVVTGFISPQDTAYVLRVNKTRPVVGKVISPEEARVKDATVRISRGSESVLLTYDQQRQVYWAYTSLLPVVAGQTYTLQVTTPDNYQVTGSCTVPTTEGVAVTELKDTVKKTPLGNGQEQEEHFFSFKWQDAPGRENYYHPVVVTEAENPRNPGRNRNLLQEEGKQYFTDEKKDGLLFSSSRSFSFWSDPQSWQLTDLHLYLAVTDRAYYLYHESLRQHRHAQDNPFAEPVLIYNNVTGGLGVFAAYNQIQATYHVE